MTQQTNTKDFAEKVNEDTLKVWSLSSFYTLESFNSTVVQQHSDYEFDKPPTDRTRLLMDKFTQDDESATHSESMTTVDVVWRFTHST